jgi:transposase
MIVIGVDAHKRTHTLVAVDANGRILGERVVDARPAGHSDAIKWVRKRFGGDVTWGVEDCRQVTAGLERALLAASQEVVRVPTVMMKRTRGASRIPGKSDPLDAAAVARAVLSEPWLPPASFDATSHQIRLLVERRDDLVGQRTATINRLLWRVHDLDPERSPNGRKALRFKVQRKALDDWLATQPGLSAELARDELGDVSRLSEAIAQLEKRINALVAVAAPALLALPGCGELTAAKIISETAGIGRFRSEAAFARLCGVAPIPSWSANSGQLRAKKYGNRQLNMALHRIAATQIRLDGAGREYYQKRRDAGDKPSKATRALKRRLARVIYNRLRYDAPATTAEVPATVERKL